MRKKSKNKAQFEKIAAKGAPFLLVTLTISILALGLAVLAAEIKDAEFVVESLQKRYDSTLDFVAEFRQETEIKALNRSLTAWGKVYFRRPGKMLWRYDEPKGQVLLADAEYLYFYQPEEKQVIKSRLSSAIRSNTPPLLSARHGRPKKGFQGDSSKFRAAAICGTPCPKRDHGRDGGPSLGDRNQKFRYSLGSNRRCCGKCNHHPFLRNAKRGGVKRLRFPSRDP